MSDKNITVISKIKIALKESIGKVCSKNLESQVDLNFLEINVEKTKNIKFGNFSSNVALALQHNTLDKMQLAQAIVDQIDKTMFENIVIAKPGFINFFMKKNILCKEIKKIVKSENKYGKFCNKNLFYNIEFVSANPTGLIHIGHARNAAIGDSLSRIWNYYGIAVDKEYYVNDGGNQIQKLTLSVLIRYLELLNKTVKVPEDGYHGDEIIEVAAALKKTYGDKFLKTKYDDQKVLDVLSENIIGDFAKKYLMGIIKSHLALLNVEHEIWFFESSIYKNDLISKTMTLLKQHTFIEENAVWLKTTELGDDKDRVLIKSDKTYTYFLPDIAYHSVKFSRGYNKMFNIWGSDHKSYADRMKIAMQLLGYKKDQLEILIMQMVKLVKNGQEYKMSKRSGDSFTTKDLVDLIGKDAARWYLVNQSVDTHIEIDLDKVNEKNSENGLYYVQYAYVRVNQLLNKQKPRGKISIDLLNLEIEKELINQLIYFRATIENIANSYEVNKLNLYLYNLSKLFHSYYTNNKIIDIENVELSNQRLYLCKAIMYIIKIGLDLLGIGVVEKM